MAELSSSSYSLLQSSSQDLQHIRGEGIAGGVAELRVNQRPIARVLIGLDGQYEFLNLDVSYLDLETSQVEVAIYEYPLAPQAVKIERIFIGKRRSRAATGEWLVEAGVGVQGNSFNRYANVDQRDYPQHTLAHSFVEYGLSNRLAVRASVASHHQNEGRYQSWAFGANFTPTTHSNLDVVYQTSPYEKSWIGDLRYQRQNLSASYRVVSRDYQPYLNNLAARYLSQTAYLSYRPFRWFGLSASHSEERYDRNEQRYRNRYSYLNFDSQLSDKLSLGAYWYSQGNRYGYRAFWQPNANSFGIQGDDQQIEGSWQHRLNDKTSFGFSVARQFEQRKDWLHRGFIHHQFSDHNSLNLGYSLTGGQLGWQGQWQFRPKQGVQFSLGYRQRYAEQLRYFDVDLWQRRYEQPHWQDQHYAYAQLRIDFWKPLDRLPEIGHYPSLQQSNIVVNLKHEAEPMIEAKNIRFNLQPLNRASDQGKMLNRNEVQAELIQSSPTHSQYLINNVRPNQYRLTLDNRNLPFEYSAVPSYTLETAQYAPTNVEIQLEKTFGISGKLANGKPNQTLNLLQAGENRGNGRKRRAGLFPAVRAEIGRLSATGKRLSSKSGSHCQ